MEENCWEFIFENVWIVLTICILLPEAEGFHCFHFLDLTVCYAFKQSPSQLAWFMYIGDVCTLLVCYFNISLSRSASLFCRVLSMLIEEGVEDIVVYLSCPSYFFLFKKRKVKKFIKAFMSNAYENTLIFALLFFFNLPVNLCLLSRLMCTGTAIYTFNHILFERNIYLEDFFF